MPRQVRIEHAGPVYQARGDSSEGISLGEARRFAQSFCNGSNSPSVSEQIRRFESSRDRQIDARTQSRIDLVKICN